MLETMSSTETDRPAGTPTSLESFDLLARARRTSLLIDRASPVPGELVDRLVRMATWAPNHKRTWPWRFAVVTGEGRTRLGQLVAAFEQRRGADEAKVAKAAGKYLRSPVVLLIGSAWDTSETRRQEDRDAVAAGVQNLLLGATAAGLASHWATGDWMADPAVKAFAGLGSDDQLVALVYLGWPSGEVAAIERPEPVVAHIES
jgi:nitroreductase